MSQQDREKNKTMREREEGRWSKTKRIKVKERNRYKEWMSQRYREREKKFGRVLKACEYWDWNSYRFLKIKKWVWRCQSKDSLEKYVNRISKIFNQIFFCVKLISSAVAATATNFCRRNPIVLLSKLSLLQLCTPTFE